MILSRRLLIQLEVEMSKERSAELNRLIRVAALSVDQYGRISTLAKLAGVSPNAISNAIRVGRFTVGLASAIELAVGPEILSREQLCPSKPSE